MTIPYVRYSTKDAHWFLARALAGLLKASGLKQAGSRRARRLELHAVSGHRGRAHPASRPDAALARPSAVRRRERRDRAAPGRPRGANAAMPMWWPASPATPIMSIPSGSISRTSRASRATRSIRSAPADRMPISRCSPRIICRRPAPKPADFGKLCVAQRDNALSFPSCAVQETAHARGISECAADRRSAEAVRLRDALRRRRRLSGAARGSCQAARPEICAHARHHRAAQCVSRRPDPDSRRLGMDRIDLYAQAGFGPPDIDLLRSLRRLSGDQLPAVRGPRLLPRRRRAGLHPQATASPSTARCRSTHPAGSCRSDRPAPPAASSVWFRRIRQVTGAGA